MKTYLELGLPGARIDFLMSERNQVRRQTHTTCSSFLNPSFTHTWFSVHLFALIKTYFSTIVIYILHIVRQIISNLAETECVDINSILELEVMSKIKSSDF